MQRVTFTLEGRDYSATFDADGYCTAIYSFADGRYLREDSESCERERNHVWTAAYTMLEN